MFVMDAFKFTTSNYIITFVIFLPTVVFYYWHRRRNDNYWKKRDLPFEPRRGWYSIVRDYARKDMSDFEMGRYQKYGRIHGYFEGSKPNIIVSEPKALKNILKHDFQYFSTRREFDFTEPLFSNALTALNGEQWRRVRNIVSPAFTTRRLKKMAHIINDCAKAVVDNLIKCAASGTPADCKKFFAAFVMDVTARTAFATRINSYENPDNPFVVHAKNTFGKNAALKTISFFLLPAFLRRLFGLFFLDQKSIDFFRNVTLQVIEERQKTGQKGDDFLQLMMDAYKEDIEAGKKVDGFASMDWEDDEQDNNGDSEMKKQIKAIYKNKSLSHDELLAQCVLFFTVGYETTASLLTFLAYNLARHPEIQEKLIEEIDSASAKAEQLDYDVTKGMEYLDRVVKETLRLQPPVIKGERTAIKDYTLVLKEEERTDDKDHTLGNRNITITKGMVVGFCIYAMHHDPKLFPDPEKFDPDRFLNENILKDGAYLPFGDGQRHCLGQRFALIEAKLCIANVLRYVRFRTCPETKIPMDLMMTQGFLTPKGLLLAVEKRNDVPD